MISCHFACWVCICAWPWPRMSATWPLYGEQAAISQAKRLPFLFEKKKKVNEVKAVWHRLMSSLLVVVVWSCSQGMFGGDERVPEMRSLSRSWLLARQTIKSCGAIWQDPVVTFGAPKILWTLVALLLQLAWLPVQVVSSAHISPVMSPGLHFFAASLMVVLPTTALRSQKGYMTFMVAWHSPWWTSYHLNNSTLYFFVFCWDRRISTGRLQNQGWRFENYSVGVWRDRYGMEMLVDSWKMAQLCFVPMTSFFLGRQISFQLPFET